ncbi:hypothetical protein GI584_14535 [Gracilibacillus salitolerans]|uniref:Uncharacterized protein n=1 Tax=Gracilibacillus salitolerans TaxID=2663022 RepID=A0A5Q2TMV7_9BACI|nr:hypothetical protein [Gracilibacillus salitolerans]QGH35190.1 hypothetical protein GI584_14535 [Gracilibacillus salitolerans]
MASDNLFPGFYEDYFQQLYYQVERVWADMAKFLVGWYQLKSEKQKELRYRELLKQLGFESSYDR